MPNKPQRKRIVVNKVKVRPRNSVTGPRTRSTGSGALKLSSGSKVSLNRAQTITEDEFIADIPGSADFAVTAYPINPGQLLTFPWASRIATLYVKYKFINLEFYYRRLVSEFNSNGSSGKVMFSLDSDASDAPPTTRQQVLDTVPHADAMPCASSMVLKVNCKMLNRTDGLYVRNGALDPATDIKTYDAGNLFVSTFGCNNTSAIGELHVRYTVQLFEPTLLSIPNPLFPPVALFEVRSYGQGELMGVSTAHTALFQNYNLIANEFGVVIGEAGDGGMILPHGYFYSIVASVYLTDADASVTAGAIALSANELYTQVLVSNAGAQQVTVTGGVKHWYSSLPEVITPTLGASNLDTVYIFATPTYASGNCYALAHLRIILLGPALAPID